MRCYRFETRLIKLDISLIRLNCTRVRQWCVKNLFGFYVNLYRLLTNSPFPKSTLKSLSYAITPEFNNVDKTIIYKIFLKFNFHPSNSILIFDILFVFDTIIQHFFVFVYNFPVFLIYFSFFICNLFLQSIFLTLFLIIVNSLSKPSSNQKL